MDKNYASKIQTSSVYNKTPADQRDRYCPELFQQNGPTVASKLGSTFFLRLILYFLFSAHISYGKGKYLNQTGFFFFFFFLQNLPRFYLYLNLRVLPIEFNPHKFSFVRYVFVEIFEVFLKNDENDENDPLMTK